MDRVRTSTPPPLLVIYHHGARTAATYVGGGAFKCGCCGKVLRWLAW